MYNHEQRKITQQNTIQCLFLKITKFQMKAIFTLKVLTFHLD